MFQNYDNSPCTVGRLTSSNSSATRRLHLSRSGPTHWIMSHDISDFRARRSWTIKKLSLSPFVQEYTVRVVFAWRGSCFKLREVYYCYKESTNRTRRPTRSNLKRKSHVPNTIQGSSIKKDTTASLVGTVEMHNVTANHYQSKWIPPSIVICP